MNAIDHLTDFERHLVDQFNPNSLEEIADAAHRFAEYLPEDSEVRSKLIAMAEAIDDFDAHIEV